MKIDLNALLDVNRSLDLIADNLTAGIPAPATAAAGDLAAVLQRLQSAASAARLSRTADLADLTDGISRLRALWITTENSLAAVPV